MMKKAIIIGASSGIGRELASVLSANDYTVGLAARRLELLTELQKEMPEKSHIKRIDMAQTAEAMRLLKELIEEMGGADIIIICAAICIYNPDLNWENELNTVNVDVVGVTAMINVAFKYFCEKGSGHIVGISSFKALRGGGSSPAYNASKAFLSNYLEGLRVNSKKQGRNIFITDIRPGLVNKSMTERRKSFFVAPVKIVASQICNAIENKERISYIPKRYNFIAYLMQNMPFCIYSRL
jgi:short-subunit dehydrogenase